MVGRAKGTERRIRHCAAAKVARRKFTKEDCVKGTGQGRKYEVVKDALIKLRGEDCAEGMRQRSSSAVAKDAPVMLKKVE